MRAGSRTSTKNTAINTLSATTTDARKLILIESHLALISCMYLIFPLQSSMLSMTSTNQSCICRDLIVTRPVNVSSNFEKIELLVVISNLFICRANCRK
eukprot:TRINITY_DN9872_c0_g1_i1.p2 TRINITY_DN9872_c0_g1~~TRINITY_DN9872_c0_g1_i1.p2  ORF type:complete len:99 (+),score=5.75 TRINITY_DN9872_c0_g1_i1:181-477(+)